MISTGPLFDGTNNISMPILLRGFEEMPPKANKNVFQVGSIVVCKHKGIPYEAKITDIKEADGPDPIYHIHYQGWNNRYDEDVRFSETANKLIEGTKENIEEAKRYREAVVNANKKRKSRVENVTDDELRKSETGSRGSSPSASSLKGKGVKRKAVDSPATTAVRSDEKISEMSIKLPKALRQILVDDNDLVSKNFLPNLPAKFTVDAIIKEYIKELGVAEDEIVKMEQLYVEYESNSNSSVSACGLVCSAMGLIDYFNHLLYYQLMYKQERPQYHELVEKEKGKGDKTKKTGRRSTAASSSTDSEEEFKPSQYYGLPHLLRLLSRLPTILKLCPWNDKVLKTITSAIHDFVVFLNKRSTKYYNTKTDYTLSSTDYNRMSQQP